MQYQGWEMHVTWFIFQNPSSENVPDSHGSEFSVCSMNLLWSLSCQDSKQFEVYVSNFRPTKFRVQL